MHLGAKDVRFFHLARRVLHGPFCLSGLSHVQRQCFVERQTIVKKAGVIILNGGFEIMVFAPSIVELFDRLICT